MRNDGTPGKRIRISGWHARPSRFLSDKNKLNEAQRLGWIVIRLSNEDVNGDPFKMVNYLREILNKRSHLVKMVESLSSREVTIIHHIAGGFVTKEIASRLEISPATVRSHAQKICHKLNVPNRSAAVARAAAWGIIAFDEIPWAEDPYSFHE